MKKGSVYAAMAGVLLLIASSADAGDYSDNLSRCLVTSSTSADKIILVKWMFTAMSLHPAVKSMANISPEQIDRTNKETAGLLVKLLTETCKEQTANAVKYEGEPAIQSSFNIFGQVAARELFSNPDVAAGMAGLEKYMDSEKVRSVLGVTKQ